MGQAQTKPYPRDWRPVIGDEPVTKTFLVVGQGADGMAEETTIDISQYENSWAAIEAEVFSRPNVNTFALYTMNIVRRGDKHYGDEPIILEKAHVGKVFPTNFTTIVKLAFPHVVSLRNGEDRVLHRGINVYSPAGKLITPEF